jgi:hypothetical protein
MGKTNMTSDQMFEEIKKIESLGHYDVILTSDGCQIWDRRFRGKATGLVIDADFYSTLEENAAHGLSGAYDYLVKHDKKIIEDENKMNYVKAIPSEGKLIAVEKFESLMFRGELNDGYGHPVRGEDMDDSVKIISNRSGFVEVPRSATHIVWFNN